MYIVFLIASKINIFLINLTATNYKEPIKKSTYI